MDEEKILDTLAKGAGLTAIGMFLSKILSYVYRSSIARFVGPEAYGTLSLAIMVATMGTTLSIFAFESAIENFIPKYRKKGNKEAIKGIIYSAFKFTVPLSILTSLSIFFLSGWISRAIFGSPELIPILKIFAFVPIFSVISGLSLSATKAFKTAKYDVLVRRIFQNIVQLAVALGLIALGYGVFGAAAGFLAGTIVAAILGLYYMESKVGPFLLSDTGKENHLRKMVTYSYPLVMSGAIGTILGWTDTAFIGYFMDTTSVGFYNAALPTAMLIMMPYSALSALVMPSMSEVMEDEEKDLARVLKTLTRWTFSITFPMFILMALFSEQALHILFGSQYTTAALSLTVLTAGYLYSTSLGHLDTVLKAMGHTEILFKNSVANFFVNIGLNILLIPAFGIIGAAAATAGSIFFTQSLLLVEVYYYKGVHPFSINSLKPAIASLPGLITVYFGLNLVFDVVPLWSLIPGVIVFGTIYILTLYLIKGIRKDEIRIMKKTYTKVREVISEQIIN